MKKKRRQTLSVIIPTKNRPALLRRVFSALSRQVPRVDEVVVVDVSVGSFQTANKMVIDAFPSLPVYYRRLPSASASRARNNGIQRSTGDILAFLDDDAVPEPGWVRAIKHAVRVGPFCFRGQCIDASESNTIVHRFYAFYKELVSKDIKRQWSFYGQWKGYQVVDFIQAGNFFIPRDILMQMHPMFDEHLFPFIGEEIDFSLRLRQSGHQILYVPEAKIRHYFLRLGYMSFVLPTAFWYGRAAAILNKRSQHSLAALGEFRHIVLANVQSKKRVQLGHWLREGFVLFRKKYAQHIFDDCLFLFICFSYVLLLGLGTVYGTLEYHWRMYFSREKVPAFFW